MMKRLFTLLLLAGFVGILSAQSIRERILFDENWQFALGDASSPAKDFGCGTEYFNYLTKANSIHNEGPYTAKFKPERWGKEWKRVDLPHDWVVDLPFAAGASHSHGYKTVGYNYPETSVGWYRKTFTVPAEDLGKHLYLQFDGIFRNARVWVNGFYLGTEPSGYTTQIYEISEYLNYGAENLVCVRADATLEEGWFYEGAGIYRHVWLTKTAPMHVAPFGTFVSAAFPDLNFSKAEITIQSSVQNSGLNTAAYRLVHRLTDADGKKVHQQTVVGTSVLPKTTDTRSCTFTLNNPTLWSTENPYLYKVYTDVYDGDRLVDTYVTTTGFRHMAFDADRGFLLNGKAIKLKGVNMHQDHAGVGAAIPDALQEYRLRQLKTFGCNAYRASHNPMTPEMLDACDRLGFLVIDENRLTGINTEHIRLLQRMIERDRNHPSVILWSIGNEEWGTEWNDFGERITASMRQYCHRFDPTRLMIVASSSGPTIIKPADVAGYNYILQNPVEQHRKDYPERRALGSEETTGSGTRGIYFEGEDLRRLKNYDQPNEGAWMVSLNRHANDRDSIYNRIARGWQFYDERPWLAGIFYWTGLDYRGEPNPMKFPATGSQFGILDYCGFPKDEAYYLKSWWTDEPVLHLLPHWNLQGFEGDSISIWAYSNCDEVELIVNGKRLGRQAMPKNGHLAWKAVYQPGSLKAIGYKNGRRVLTQEVATTGKAERIILSADRMAIQADNRDLSVVRIDLQDKKRRFVPDACCDLTLTVDGSLRILGVGNGDPGYQATERPADREARTYHVRTFNGLAQVLLQNNGTAGTGTLTVSGEGLETAVIEVMAE